MLKPSPPDSEPEVYSGAEPETLWSQLGQAESPEAAAGPWLGLQCRMIPGVRRGLCLLGPADRGPYAVASVWPMGAPPKHLLEAAQRILAGRRPETQTAEAPGPQEASSLVGPIFGRPLESGGRLHGAVVLELGPRSETDLGQAHEQLRWGAGWLEAGLVRDRAAAAGQLGSRFRTVLELLAATIEQERFRGAATALATELATALKCERVAVGFLQRGGVQLAALSHSAHFGKKTNLVGAIEAAMGETVDQQAPILYPATSDVMARGTHAHAELARHHDAGSICSVPLVHGEDVCGAIVLERPAEAPQFASDEVELCEAVAALVGPVLEVQRREDRWLLAKAAEAFRIQVEHFVGPRHTGLKIGVVATSLLLLFLLVAKGDYRVTANAVLEPLVVRASVTPFNGFVASAPARAGDLVSEGQVLAQLDDRDLGLEEIRWLSEEAQYEKQYRQALAERDAAGAEMAAAALAEARAELARIQDRLSRTEIRAPFDGVVVTGDLSQQLGAPVEKGETLFEVAPLDAYRLILEVDERDIAAVRVGQPGRLVLSSLPDDPLDFEIAKITPVAKAEEGANFFRVEAGIDLTDERLRPAIEGVGKIEVGRRRLFWIWTHQGVDWLRLKLWSWLP